MKVKGIFCWLTNVSMIFWSIAIICHADTNVSGYISTDTTWTSANSPYVVTQSLLINSGATLTIEPGVTVKFVRGKGLQINGSLISRGSSTNKITFTSNQSTPASGDWGSIVFGNSSIDATYDANGGYISGSIIENCIIEYAGGENAKGAVTMSDSYPFVNYCSIKNNMTSGIYASYPDYDNSKTLKISNCDISNNISSLGGGISTYYGGYGGGLIITNNIISNNSASYGGGIYAYYSHPEISKNIIVNNTATYGGGIYTEAYSSADIFNNIISNNIASSVGGGIYICYCESGYYMGKPNLSTNVIYNNTAQDAAAVYYNHSATYNFKYNTITKNTSNSYTIYVLGSYYNPDINSNNIYANIATYELWNDNSAGSDPIDVTNSWWGTAIESDIQTHIYDWFDDASKGLMDYYPYETDIRTDCPISPPTGITTTAGTEQITLSWSANSESDLKGYKIYWDTDSSHSYSNSTDVGNTTNYTITGLSTGKYYVTVTAYDTNYTASTDDTSTPVNENMTNGNESWYAEEKAVTIGTGVTSDTNAPNGSVIINSGASYYTNSTTVTLSLSATDNIGVTGYYISDSSTTPSASASGWTSVISTTSYSGTVSYSLNSGEGAKTIYVWYKDASGNVSATASATIILDTTVPTVNITSPTTSSIYTTTISTTSLGGSASDSVSGINSVTWNNNRGGSGVAIGTDSWTISGISLSSGDNIITVTAIDGAGNSGTDTIQVTYNADSTISIPKVATGAASNVSTSSATLSGTVNANGASTTAWFQYGTTRGSYGSTSSTQSVSGSSDTTVSIGISGLTSNTTYYFRIAASNSAGTSYGSEASFTTTTTAATPIPTPTPSSSKTPQISSGEYFSLVKKTDGTVWGWGDNGSGQLGDGSYISKTIPGEASGLSELTSIAAGANHSLAIVNGKIWVWGNNEYGQLGVGTYYNSNSPQQLTQLNNVSATAGGGYHSIALKDDGTVWAWGDNWYGELGDGSNISKTTPVQVVGINEVIAIAAGWGYSLALKSDGTVWAWGDNFYGQLGDGTNIASNIPIQVRGLNGIISISSGPDFAIVLKSDGTVWAWGNNLGASLGDGTYNSRSFPGQVSGLSDIIAIAAGGYHGLALKEGGTLYGWGYNGSGQLGDGSTNTRTIPIQINTISDVIAICGGYSHTVILKDDYTVWTSGDNSYGQLGNNTTTSQTTFVQVNINLGKTIESSEGMIYGFVYNEQEEPFKGVVVTLQSDIFTGTTETDKEGYYEFKNLDSGGYTLTYEMEDYTTQTKDVNLGENEELEIDDVLMESIEKGGISGYVVDIYGDPIENVKLTVKGIKTGYYKITSSDADGFFEFSDLDPDTYMIYTKKKRYKKTKKVVKVNEGEVKEIEIELRRTTSRNNITYLIQQ